MSYFKLIIVALRDVCQRVAGFVRKKRSKERAQGAQGRKWLVIQSQHGREEKQDPGGDQQGFGQRP